MTEVIPIKYAGGVFGQFASDDTIPALYLPIDTDGTLAANSDSKIATQKAVRSAVMFGGARLPSVAVDDFVCTAMVADQVSSQWAGSTVNSVNVCRFTQFAVGYTIKTAALRMECTQAASTGSLRLGIFADNAGRPGVVQAQGTVAWAAAMLEATFTEVTLTPGVYWAAACAQHTSGSSANPLYKGVQRGAVNVGWPSPAAGSSYFPVLQATISGSFADNPSTSYTTNTASMAPVVYMKVTARP